jgi:hypothetical protein
MVNARVMACLTLVIKLCATCVQAVNITRAGDRRIGSLVEGR